MSRVGKKPIIIPQGVDVTIKDKIVSVSGPKGKLQLKLHPSISVHKVDTTLTTQVKNPVIKRQSALWGLYRNLVKNMVKGVTEGFKKELEINGVGYKAAVQKGTLNLSLGFSHPIEFLIPEGIEIGVNKNIIQIIGIDKQKIGNVAAQIRSLRTVEPYKGKGIRYVGEYVRKKAGKTAVKSE